MQRLHKAALILDLKNDPERASEILLEIVTDETLSPTDPVRVEALAFLADIGHVYDRPKLILDSVNELNRLDLSDVEPDLIERSLKSVAAIAAERGLSFRATSE